MKIHWNNIALLILAILVVVIWMRAGDSISGFFANIKNIGPGHTTDEQTQGVIALGFLCAAFIAGFRLLMRKYNN